jgi:hypothetical protein
MAKFGQNYDKISFPRNSSVTAGRNGTISIRAGRAYHYSAVLHVCRCQLWLNLHCRSLHQFSDKFMVHELSFYASVGLGDFSKKGKWAYIVCSTMT